MHIHVYTNADRTTYLPQCLPAYLPTYVCTYVRTLREYMKAGAIHTDFACLLSCLLGWLLTYFQSYVHYSLIDIYILACMYTDTESTCLGVEGAPIW